METERIQTTDSQIEKDFKIEGMSCASCVFRVENSVGKKAGVLGIAVNLATETARVKLTNEQAISSVIEGIEQAGYKGTVVSEESESVGEGQRTLKLKRERISLYLAAALTVPLVLPMLLAPLGIELSLPAWAQMLLATPVQFLFGWRFYQGAWKALKARAGNMDLLVALGTSAAYGLSLYLMWQFSDHGHSASHLYFESSAVIITLVLLGKYLEAVAKHQTSAAIKALQKLRPDTARVLRGKTEIELPLGEVKLGDLVVVRPGEKLPVDGEIIDGDSQIDESLITGESLPVAKTLGDKVTGGSINSDGRLLVKVTALGSETTLARIIRLVESAQSAKAPIQKLVDKVSAIFVPVVVLVALFTIVGWGFWTGNWEAAIINGVAVLVIACPCALGLATPASIMVGTGLGARAGILIKDAEALEVAHSVTAVAFDKTGTLTEGRPKVSALVSNGLGNKELLALAASVQAGSEHPLAKTVLAAAKTEGIMFEPAQDFKAIAGKGLKGRIGRRTIFVGTQILMKEQGISTSALDGKAQEFAQQGHTVSFLGEAGQSEALGVIAFKDTLKNSAKQTIDELRRQGIKTIMLTGDNKGAAANVARELGISEVRAEVLPEDKSKIIEELKGRGEIVAMVGDGINDAPALASANVGIAMSTGTDVAMHTAGITLMRGNPLLIPDAIEISRKTYNKIKQNLFWAFIYNVIGIPLAMSGLLNPMLAGLAMALSSVSVITNALLLKRWKPNSQVQAGRIG